MMKHQSIPDRHAKVNRQSIILWLLRHDKVLDEQGAELQGRLVGHLDWGIKPVAPYIISHTSGIKKILTREKQENYQNDNQGLATAKQHEAQTRLNRYFHLLQYLKMALTYPVVISDLKRAEQTFCNLWQMAMAMGWHNGQPPNYQKQTIWREQNFGDWQGKNYQEIEANDKLAYDNFWQDPIFQTPGSGKNQLTGHKGESFYQLYQRIKTALVLLVIDLVLEQELVTEKLIVAHGGVLRAVLAWYFYWQHGWHQSDKKIIQEDSKTENMALQQSLQYEIPNLCLLKLSLPIGLLPYIISKTAEIATKTNEPVIRLALEKLKNQSFSNLKKPVTNFITNPALTQLNNGTTNWFYQALPYVGNNQPQADWANDKEDFDKNFTFELL